MQINETLVDPHLKPVPGLGPFSTGGLTCGDLQVFGGHTHRSLDLQLLVLGPTDQISTNYKTVIDTILITHTLSDTEV